MMILLLLAAAGPAHAGCPADAATFRTDVEAALDAYGRWDWGSFDRLRAGADLDVVCLGEVPVVADVARYHLMRAFAAARVKDEPAATAALRALLSLDPNYALSEDVAAEGSMLRRAWESARNASPSPRGTLSGDGWWIDGTEQKQMPLQHAALVQHRDPDLQSWYLDGSNVPLDVAGKLEDIHWRPKPVFWTGVGAAVLSVAAFSTAAVADGKFADEADFDKAQGLADLNHASLIGGIATGVGAAGLLVAGVVVGGRW